MAYILQILGVSVKSLMNSRINGVLEQCDASGSPMGGGVPLDDHVKNKNTCK